MRVCEIMSRGYYLARADEPLLAILARMMELGVQDVVVCEGARVRGLLSRSDIAAQVGAGLYYHVEEQLKRKGELEEFFHYLCPLKAGDLPLRRIPAVTPQHDLQEAADLFDEVCQEVLPVVEEECIVGVVYRGDLYNRLLGRQPRSRTLLHGLTPRPPAEEKETPSGNGSARSA